MFTWYDSARQQLVVQSKEFVVYILHRKRLEFLQDPQGISVCHAWEGSHVSTRYLPIICKARLTRDAPIQTSISTWLSRRSYPGSA